MTKPKLNHLELQSLAIRQQISESEQRIQGIVDASNKLIKKIDEAREIIARIKEDKTEPLFI